MASDDEKKRGKDDSLDKKSKHGKEHRAGAKRRRREEQGSGGSVISRDPALAGADEKRKSVPSGPTTQERSNADVMTVAASHAGPAAIHPASNSVQQLPPRQEPGTEQGGPYLSSSEVLSQHLPVDQQISQQTTNEAIPFLNPNQFVQQPSTIQEMLRQTAQAALRSGQPPPPSSHFFPPNNAPTANLHPLMGGPRYMGPHQQQQPAPFYQPDSARQHQQQQQLQNTALSNSQLLSVLSSFLQLLEQQQQQLQQQAPPFPQAAAANVLASLIRSSFGQQQQAQQEQEQSRGGGTLNSMLYAPPNAAAASMLQQGQPPQVPALHPNLMALLHNFAASTTAAASNNNPEPNPPRAAAAADPARSYHTSNSDGNVSSNSGGSDLAMELSGRPPVVMYIPEVDDRSLSEYQCLVRKQIEIFEATHEDVECQAQGRNKPIFLGQVGIRCRHCTSLPLRHRARGAVFFPSKARGIYQAAQNMANTHLSDQCQHIPANLKALICQLQSRKSSAGGGKT